MILISVLLALIILAVTPQALVTASAVLGKLAGRFPDSSIWDAVAAYGRLAEFSRLFDEKVKNQRTLQIDEAAGLELVKIGADEPFWIQRERHQKGSSVILAAILAEHEWLHKLDPLESVRHGDVVVDCGAHVGTFTRRALVQGAAKVIAIEPMPKNIECLRRNFQKQIESGQVAVVPEGVWDKPDTLDLSIDAENSGGHSLVHDERGPEKISVPVNRLDDILSRLGISRVTFVKMDIEGAERKALAGASDVIARDKPRLMIAVYHNADDRVILPRLIRELNAGYRRINGPIGAKGMGPQGAFHFDVAPHMLYFN